MSPPATRLSRHEATAIAQAFLPARRFGNRTPYYYVRSKLAADPLYGGIVAVLRDSHAPLLDLGCGLGLLVHTLRRAGVEPRLAITRGGTDGAVLSSLGLPTPNLFTGGQEYHSVREWASVQDMAAAAATIVELASVWAEQLEG